MAKIFIKLFCFLCIVRITFSLLTSGVYTDNEMGQTMVHHVTRKEKREIAKDVLTFFDLPLKSRSTKKPPVNSRRSTFQYIYEIYKNISTIKDSDVIATYALMTNRSKANDFWFDLTDTPKVDRVVAGELHLNLNALSDPITISLYSFVHWNENKKRLRFITSMTVPVGHKGWIKLNVTEALNYWLGHPKSYVGFHVSIRDFGNGVTKIVDPNLINSDPEVQPFLVGYYVSSGVLSQRSSVMPRLKRNSAFYSPLNYLDNPYTVKDSSRRRKNSKACQMRSLHVRFDELDFDKMIVAPESYDAQFCAGECRFPLNAHMNVTNHAIVQTLVHFLYPGRVPQPCCVPHELDELPVLYSHDNENYAIRKYPDMVIKSCGCH